MLTVIRILNFLQNKFKLFIQFYLQDISIKILYKSPNYIVVNKQPDMVINTDFPEKFPVTTQTQLRTAFPHLVNPRLKHEFHFCHRLDYVTSGAMCVALNRAASSDVLQAFLNKKVDKYYIALLRGHVSKNTVKINIPIGKDSRSDDIHRMCISSESYCVKEQSAETLLIVLQRGICYNYPASKVLLKPLTGRRHQLRVHCQYLGHTIIGDYTYSNFKDVIPYRTFLHAYRLRMKLKKECIDVIANDPFVEQEPRNRWVPVETVYELNDQVFSLFNDENKFS